MKERWSVGKFNLLSKSDSDLVLKVIGFMSDRIGQLMNSLDMLTQVNANQRLVRYFAEIYRKQNSVVINLGYQTLKKCRPHNGVLP